MPWLLAVVLLLLTIVWTLVVLAWLLRSMSRARASSLRRDDGPNPPSVIPQIENSTEQLKLIQRRITRDLEMLRGKR